MLAHLLVVGLRGYHSAPSVLNTFSIHESENAPSQRIESRDVEIKYPVEVEALPYAVDYVVLKL